MRAAAAAAAGVRRPCEAPRALLLRMRCMKRAQVDWYVGCSISGVKRRNVNDRIIGSSDCGRSDLDASLSPLQTKLPTRQHTLIKSDPS